MARSSLEAFSALWRAYGEGRLDESLDLIDPDCEVTFAGAANPMRGHDGVRDCLDAARHAWKTLRIVYDDVFEDHPGCVVGSGRVAASATGDGHVDREFAFVAEFHDQRLVRARVLTTLDEAIGAARALRRVERRPA
jgi:ketosteroid isomerase-like protein